MPRTLSEPEFNAIRDAVIRQMPPNLSEAEFDRLVGQAVDGAVAAAENSPKPVEGSAIGRFASNAWDMLNPVTMTRGVYQAVTNPIDTANAMIGAQAQQFGKAADDVRAGHYFEAVGHSLAGTVPLVGPAAAEAGEQIAQGDIAGGMGRTTGILAPVSLPTIARAVKKITPMAVRNAIAGSLEEGAASRVADVMAPKVGANKTRFGGMAEDVAPQVAKDLAENGSLWSRSGLQAKLAQRLTNAEQALDAAADARLASRSFPTDQILAKLLEKRRALTAEAIEGSEYPRVRQTPPSVTRGQQLEGITGELSENQVGAAKPIGQDVVPGPNAARVAVIDEAIAEIRQLGKVARYEPIRRLRQAYDGPAKAVYNPSITQDFIKAQGGKLGAADVTAVLRDELAKWDPETRTANAAYSLYRKASDVLEATSEVERTRPRIGRQIIARLTGTVIGESAAGLKGAAVGYVLGPAVDAMAASGATTQLKTAALMQRLATAIRRGDTGAVTSLASQVRSVAAKYGPIRAGQVTTSPSGSQSQTTVPALSTP